MNQNGLSKTLSRLLFEKNIRPTELSRQTNVPQPTIQRIVAGTTTRPHISSLKPIADFFAISIEQLQGLQPISWLQTEKNLSAYDLNMLPILAWHQINEWLTATAEQKTTLIKGSILCDATISPKAFALKIKDASMEPVFSIGTTIIVDPNKELKDRSYVIAKLHHADEAVLRQVIVNAMEYYVRPLSPDLTELKMHKLTQQDIIHGVLVQAKRDFE